MRRTNSHVLQGSLKNFEMAQRKQLSSILGKAAAWFLQDAYSMRSGWLGFTGNLPTSYAAAVYDGEKRLIQLMFIGDIVSAWSRPTVSPKVPTGHTWRLTEPYEGGERIAVWSDQQQQHIKNPSPVYFPDGRKFSEWFLKSFTPERPWSVVVCTGAEYSIWLEQDRETGGVLTDSSKNVKRVFEASLDKNKNVFDKYFNANGLDQGLSTLYDAPF